MLWRSFKKLFTYEIILLFTFIAIYIICRLFNITCLIYVFTKIPCPTCYMGRALYSALKGDFYEYIRLNIMAIPVFLVFIAELYGIYFDKYRNIIHGCSVPILIINIVYYFIRLAFFFQVI